MVSFFFFIAAAVYVEQMQEWGLIWNFSKRILIFLTCYESVDGCAFSEDGLRKFPGPLYNAFFEKRKKNVSRSI